MSVVINVLRQQQRHSLDKILNYLQQKADFDCVVVVVFGFLNAAHIENGSKCTLLLKSQKVVARNKTERARLTQIYFMFVLRVAHDFRQSLPIAYDVIKKQSCSS